MPKKIIWANFQRIIELFTQKIVKKLSKIWVWDPGSETRKKLIPDPGSRIQGSKRHRIPDPDPQHCLEQNVLARNETILLGTKYSCLQHTISLMVFRALIKLIIQCFMTGTVRPLMHCRNSNLLI